MKPILERGGAGSGGCLSRLRAGARRPGQQELDDQDDAEARRGRDRRVPAPHRALYRQIVDTVIPVSSPMVAETAKLHENTFRAVNIAQTSWRSCATSSGSGVGGDRGGLLEAVRVPAALPGPGLGGDCIPVVPHFLAAPLRAYGYSPQLIEAAHEINTRMPAYVVQKVADALNEQSRPIKGSRILLLGMAYKADVHDTRESPSFEVMRQLLARGGDTVYCDPWVLDVELDGALYQSVDWSVAELERADCAVMLTQHRQFSEQPLWEHARLVVDARNVVPPARASTASSIRACGSSCSVPGTSARGSASSRSSAATKSCLPTTGTRPTVLSSRASRSFGARVESADIRVEDDVAAARGEPGRLFLLAAQASRPISEREPNYTEETNATGVRPVAEAVAARGGPPVVFGSLLHVYGTGLEGEVGADRPYGRRMTSRT